MARILLIILCLSTSSWAIRVYNGTTSSKLGTRERNRRLIPYMTFYLAQPVDQSLSQVDPSYVQYSPPPEKDRGWPYPPAQPPPIEQPQYLVAPQQYQTYDNRYLQQPQLNKFAQNYLAIPKQYKKVQQPRPNVYSQDAPHPESYSIALAPFKQNNQGDQLLQEVEEPLQYNVQPQLQQHLQYRPNVVATQLTPNQYKTSYDTQYRPEVILQYQTPAPRPLNFQYKRPTFKTQKQHEQQTIKQHLTEITRPVSRPVAYVPQKEDLSGYTVEQKQPSYESKVDESGYSGGYNEQSYIPTTTVGATEPSVSIMQSQELEVMTEPPQVQTPIATVAPKYRVTVSSAPKYHAVYVAQTTTTPSPVSALQGYKEHYEYDEVGDRNLNNILQGVSLSKTLPDRITPENLDSSIKSLSKLLKILQRANALPQTAKEIVRTFPRPVQPGYSPNIQRIPHKKPSENDEGGATPGQAGIDYPVYDAIPQTRFSCKTQRYKGFFGDPETRCQVWHYCDLNGGQASFLCPNGTIFSQVALTCDWWFNVKCASTAQLYVLNERLYKYILPKKPSFPEDYAGPLVDTYLTNKFKELEQAKNNKTEDASMDDKDLDPLINDKDHQYSLDDVESENKVIRSILGLDT